VPITVAGVIGTAPLPITVSSGIFWYSYWHS